MAQDDFAVAREQARDLALMRQSAELEWNAARAAGDTDTMKLALQEMANIDAKGEALNALYQKEMARRNPPQEERESVFARSGPPKDGNDVLEIMNYGKKPGDPTYVTPEEYNRGLAELHRRKAQGDYRGKP